MEKEFSFKDLLAYYLKRWLIVAVCLIIGAFLFLITFAFEEKNEEVHFKASAQFYGITKFLHDLKDLNLSEDSPALVLVYQNAAFGVYNAMNSDYVKNAFVNSDEYISLMTRLKSEMSKGTIPTQKELKNSFIEFFEFEVRESMFSVSLSGRFDTEEKVKTAQSLLKHYITSAVEFAYQNQGVPPRSVIVTDPVEVFEKSQGSSGNGYAGRIFSGMAVGTLFGALIVFVMFSFDKRLKSFEMQMSQFGGGLLGVSADGKIDENSVLSIVSMLGNDKTLLLASARKDSFVSNFSAEISKKFAELGLKTLHIDFCTSGTKAVCEQIPKETPDFERLDGYFRLSAKGKSDWTSLISHKAEFERTVQKFDKVVLTYCEDGGRGAAVLKDFIDKVLYVVNQKNTKFSSFEALSKDLKKEGIAIGTYIFNPI